MASESDRIVREIEVLGLKQEAKEAAGGEMTCWEAKNVPLGLQEAYWSSIVTWEKAPWVTPAEELAKEGIVPVGLEKTDDGNLPTALWALIASCLRPGIPFRSLMTTGTKKATTRPWRA